MKKNDKDEKKDKIKKLKKIEVDKSITEKFNAPKTAKIIMG